MFAKITQLNQPSEILAFVFNPLLVLKWFCSFSKKRQGEEFNLKNRKDDPGYQLEFDFAAFHQAHVVLTNSLGHHRLACIR